MSERRLEVLLYGRLIGRVTQSPHGARRFRYLEDYGGTEATPLSLSMSLSTAEHVGRRIDPYLQGLLPDSAEVLERWAEAFAVSPRNPFARLEHMGLDCAGAVQFVPEGRASTTFERDATVQPLSRVQIGARIRQLRQEPSSWKVSGEHWSLGGAQSKFTLAAQDGDWFETLGGATSTHIVKPGISGYRDQALIEHVCLTALRGVGLPAARSSLEDFDGETALVVTRFDRRRDRSGTVVRVHQEDMCQALSVYPRRKYEGNGGPSSVQIVDLLRTRASDPEGAVRQFVDAHVANYLLGAPDAHAKNFAVLLAGSQVALAPLYDVASALPYDVEGTATELDRAAMAIGGERRFGHVTARHWESFARRARIDGSALRERVIELAGAIPPAVDEVLSSVAQSELHERFMVRLTALCAQTARDA